MRTSLWLAALLSLSLAAPVGGCSSPYSGKSEKLSKPRKKKRPDGEEPAKEVAETAAGDDQCRTNFFEEPTKRRDPRGARSLADQASRPLFEAERQEGDRRLGLVVEAIGKLSNALAKDPYAPEPTYKLAVAYALAGRKACSLALLDRLKTLLKHPAVERDTKRTIQRAVRDPAFDAFRKDADTALGE
jgi:hypothetical protein